MRRRATKIILRLVLAFCLLFVGVTVALLLTIKTGPLRTLIEQRVEEATGMKVHMKSLRLLWPIGLEAEALTVASSVYETKPLLTCPRLRIKTSFGTLLRRSLVSVELLGPRVNLGKDELAGLRIPGTAPGSKGSTAFSVGTFKIIKGYVSLDLPDVKGNLDGIFVTFGKPVIPSGAQKVLTLNFDNAHVTVGNSSQRQTPISLSGFESKFSLQPTARSTEVSGDVFAYVTTTIPYLLLPPYIPISLSLATDYFPGRESLENGIFTLKIPLLSDVRVYGSVTNLMGSPSPDLDFSFAIPEVANTLEYNELLQRPQYKGLKMAGTLQMSGEIGGTFSKPELSFKSTTKGGRFEWRGTTIKGLDLDIPVSVGVKGFALGPAQVDAQNIAIPLGEKQVEASQLHALLTADGSRASVSELDMKLANSVQLKARGEYEFGSGQFAGNVSTHGVSIKKAIEFVPSKVYKIPEGFEVDGNVDLDCSLDGKLQSSLEKLTTRFNLVMEKGAFSTGEFVSADNIKTRLKGTIQSGSPKEFWNFHVDGDVGDFEVLVDTFYKAFPQSAFPFSLSGRYAMRTKQLQNTDISLDLGKMGKLNAHGTAQLNEQPEIEARVKATKIDLAGVFQEAGEQILSAISPAFKEATVSGTAAADLDVSVANSLWKAGGRLDVADGQIRLTDNSFALDSVAIRLPFDIHSPKEKRSGSTSFEEEDYGKIQLGNLVLGPSHISSLDLEVALKNNDLHIKGPISSSLFGGVLSVGDIRGQDILGRSAELTTSLSTEGIDVGQISEAMGLPKIAAKLNAQFPGVTMTSDAITTTGSAQLNVFDGTIDIDSVTVEEPFSPVRTFKANMDFKDINLSSFTSVFKFGLITGIMDGTIQDLEISHGQPAAFIANFETVRQRGISQKISFDAVENISILGTGHGLQASLGRGFFSFFNELGYDVIGFRCTLKNDNFKIQGKAVKDNTEYLVKGVMFGPSINVINRNPGQTVSWKSMLERISRIEQKQKTEEK